MKAIALKFGLAETATESEVIAKIGELQQQAGEAVSLRTELAKQTETAITAAVDNAVKLRRITADKKNHFVELGKKIGLLSLNETLNMMQPSQRPTDIINGSSAEESLYKKLSDVPTDKIIALRSEDLDSYRKLYKAEYGIEPKD